MSDDLWRELAQVNREKQSEERDRLGEHWDRLSSGELSPEEEAELRALAETSEEAREAWEAFRPLGPDFHASVVQAIREQALAPKPPANLLPFPRRATRLAGWSTVAAAVAAAVLVLLLRPPAPLPEYELSLSGGVSEMRGEPAEEVLELAPGDRFEIILEPQTAASRGKRLESRCFLARSQDLRLLEIQSQSDPRGAVKMAGAIPRDLRPGTWTLWALAGRRGKLPEPADLLSAKAPVRQRDWVALPQEIHIKPREDLQP
jgi:hypothetical protein